MKNSRHREPVGSMIATEPCTLGLRQRVCKLCSDVEELAQIRLKTKLMSMQVTSKLSNL